MSAVTGTWALHETANSTISVAKGLIQAASSDNVQALALVACKAFGATLAVCPETCLKVERIAGMHHQSATVKFLKAQIGYSPGDSAAQLALDMSGVRFLGLAAALNTLGAFQGALALESMLTSSARGEQPLPTVTQLKELLLALDYKLNRTGFAASLVGWGLFFTNHPLISAEEQTALSLQMAASPDETKHLVRALRELARLGDATQVTVTVGIAAPWVTAFIKWSLGIPPSIYAKDGTPLLEQPGSRITLVVIPSRAFFDNMEITISREMDTVLEIVKAPSGQESWSGMVSVRTYAEHKIQHLEMHSGIAKQALYQALPYAVKQASHFLQPADLTDYADLKPQWKSQRESRVVYEPKLRQQLPEELSPIAGKIFDSDSVLSAALSDFLGVRISTPLPVLSEGTLISDLSMMRLYRESVKSDCKCVECCGQSESLYSTCMWKGTLKNFSSIVADVLALSLLDCTEPVLVYIKSRFQSPQPCLFDMRVDAVLAQGKSTLCCVEEVIDWALRLAGHGPSNKKGEDWIMSSYRGQTFYPRLFETETLEGQGLLVLSGAPGLLRHDGQVYQNATTARMERRLMPRTLDSIMSRLSGVPVRRPLNLLQEHSIKWQVAVVEDGLQVAVLSTAAPATYNPFAILCAAVQSLYVEACPHRPDVPLAEIDQCATYTSPYFPWGEGNERPTKLGVVPVHGNQGMRMLCLVGGIAGVVQQNACLQCCLDVCRKANYPFVIDGRMCVEEDSP